MAIRSRDSYDTVGLLSQIDFFSGGTATGAYDVYSYASNDPRNLLKTITMYYKNAAGQPTQSVIDYANGSGNPAVDKAGNLLSMTDLAGHWTYIYDHGGRISSIVPPNPVPEQGLGGTYGYNWLGQLTNPPAEPNHLQYNQAGLPSLWPGMYSYTYKDNGAPYEVKNPSGSSVIASGSYDAAGYPDTFAADGITTRYTWDADGIMLGYSQTSGGSETGSALTDPATGCVLMDAMSGSAVSYVCDPQGGTVASFSSAGSAYYHADGAGCIVMSTKSDGKVGGTYTRGPDGKIASTNDPQGANRLFGLTGSRLTPPPGAGLGSPDMSAVLRAFNELPAGTVTSWKYYGTDGWTRDLANDPFVNAYRRWVYQRAKAGKRGQQDTKHVSIKDHFHLMCDGKSPEDVVDLGSFDVDAYIDSDNIYFTVSNDWDNNSKWGWTDLRRAVQERFHRQLPPLPFDHTVHMNWYWAERLSDNRPGLQGKAPRNMSPVTPVTRHWTPMDFFRGVWEDPVGGPILRYEMRRRLPIPGYIPIPIPGGVM